MAYSNGQAFTLKRARRWKILGSHAACVCFWGRSMMVRPNPSGLAKRSAHSLNVAACALALAGCATLTRVPYTHQEQAVAVVPGIPDARIWADDPAVSSVRRSVVSRVSAKQPVVLALSGGAADAPLGASLLPAWPAPAPRPTLTHPTLPPPLPPIP